MIRRLLQLGSRSSIAARFRRWRKPRPTVGPTYTFRGPDPAGEARIAKILENLDRAFPR